jgi:hypothetical protein
VSSILRKRLTRGWTGVPNATLRDRRISYRATGVLAYLLSMDDGWSMDARILAEGKEGEGRDAILTALRELRQAGYVHHTKRRTDAGRFVTEVEVSDVPVDAWRGGVLIDLTKDGKPDPGEPEPGKPTPGHPEPGCPTAQEETCEDLQETDDGVDEPTSPSRTRPETEAEDRTALDDRGAQLVAEIADVLTHPELVARLYQPADAGCRRILGRELATREANGWPTTDLVVEVASGITLDAGVTSVAALCLTRARRLQDRPYVTGAVIPHGINDQTIPGIGAYRASQTEAARRHGHLLATTGLDLGELLAELEHRYADRPDDPTGERFTAAMQGAGFLDDACQATDQLRKLRHLGGAA